jgi:putative membrane protein
MPQPVEPNTGELKAQSTEIKRSAKAVEDSAVELTDSADRRTTLAGDRTLLAAERTYAAWVRTALAALASGVGARALMKGVLSDWVGRFTGSMLVIFAGFCLVAAVWRELRGAIPPPVPDIPRLSGALLIPINAFLLMVAIAVLIGLWTS